MKLLLYDRTVREKYRQNIQEVRLMYVQKCKGKSRRDYMNR